MPSSVTKDDLNLDGVVRYTLVRDSSGQSIIDAKWVSTRIIGSGQTGTGRAVRRRSGGDSIHKVLDGFEGDWNIEYFGPDGQLAVTPFLLTLSKNDQVRYGVRRLHHRLAMRKL
ncbi:hypothetical protein ACJZ2D_006380 [Fusarium nematophilum]